MLRRKEKNPHRHLFLIFEHTPDCRCIAELSELSLRLVAGQKLVEVSVLHVLCDHTERVAVDAYSKQANDVGVLQTGHDLYLFQEVIPTNTKRQVTYFPQQK